jgi:hypothetical protein
MTAKHLIGNTGPLSLSLLEFAVPTLGGVGWVHNRKDWRPNI